MVTENLLIKLEVICFTHWSPTVNMKWLYKAKTNGVGRKRPNPSFSAQGKEVSEFKYSEDKQFWKMHMRKICDYRIYNNQKVLNKYLVEMCTLQNKGSSTTL